MKSKQPPMPLDRRTLGARRLDRRVILKGLGGATLALPWLETLAPRRASAADSVVPPFAIFFRQANGVAALQETLEIGNEPERFWPREVGALTPENVAGRALEELGPHLPKILAIKNVNAADFDYGDGHARGALQGLTAQGPVVLSAGGDSEAAGESLDHRIGRELNSEGRDSLFLYAGAPQGWLGGPCISYRGAANRRSALVHPHAAYLTMIGGGTGLNEEATSELSARNRSVNDLVREQLGTFLARTDLSARDRERLDLHLTSIRDLENTLACQMSESEERALDGLLGYDGTDGDLVLEGARAHMDVAALAVACGFTRSVAIQVGNGNDSLTRYWDDDGNMMENFHYVSHRRASHDDMGAILLNSDVLHSQVDRQFARTFAHLLDRLASYPVGEGTLLDCGVAVWYNDLSNGPAHGPNGVPYILAGSAGGYFKQGEYVDTGEEGWLGARNHARVLNTIATAVGCRTEGKDVCDDFGDETLDRTPLDLLAAG